MQIHCYAKEDIFSHNKFASYHSSTATKLSLKLIDRFITFYLVPQLPEYPNLTNVIIMNQGFTEEHFLVLPPNSGNLIMGSRLLHCPSFRCYDLSVIAFHEYYGNW